MSLIPLAVALTKIGNGTEMTLSISEGPTLARADYELNETSRCHTDSMIALIVCRLDIANLIKVRY